MSPKPTQANVPYGQHPKQVLDFGAGLAERLQKIGVEYEFNYLGATGLKHPDMFSFLLEKLQVSPAK